MNCFERLSAWMEPVWKGDHLVDECVLFTQTTDGQPVQPCRLLFKPSSVLEVRNDYLGIVYKEGIDYIIDDGAILLSENSRIPFFGYDELYLREPASIPIKSVNAPGRYVRYEAAGVETIKRQIKVSYTHTGNDSFSAPHSMKAFFPRTVEKLVNKQPLKIVFCGDSVMEGCDASGKTGLSPYMPQIDRLAVYKLADWYEHSRIHFVNTSVSGTTSQWGFENVHSRVINFNPDLVIFRFGVNDGSSGKPAERYAENICRTAETLRSAVPKSECLIMTSDLPNADCDGWMGTNEDLEPALQRKIKNQDGTAILYIKDLYKQIRAVKGYYSLTANFVNHPNDFMIRLYAQLLCAALGVYEEANPTRCLL